MGNKFDFRQGEKLSQSMVVAADKLDVYNGQMEKKFAQLAEFFRDSGYDEYSVDMDKANKAISDVVEQMKHVGRAIAEYASRLKEAQ